VLAFSSIIISEHLSQVYLPAIKGLVPPRVVEALSSFLDFCYLVRRPDFDESTLDSVDAAVLEYHARREVFRDLKVRDHFSLPRQHSMKHYGINIEDFGAPGGVCSSITESHHITTVKKPWRQSSRHQALPQILLTNQHLDMLTASTADFIERSMIAPVFTAIPDKVPKDEEAEEIDEPRVENNVILARRRVMSVVQYVIDYSLFTVRTFISPTCGHSWGPHQASVIPRSPSELLSQPASFGEI
jgi:hypothetical protein